MLQLCIFKTFLSFISIYLYNYKLNDMMSEICFKVILEMGRDEMRLITELITVERREKTSLYV